MEKGELMRRIPTLLLALIIIFLLAANAFTRQAQNASPAQNANPLSSELKQMYNGVKNNLTNMAEKMPEEHYGFKATSDIRTFGQLIGHVADSQARA